MYVSESSFLANNGVGPIANGGGATITMSLNQLHVNATNGFVAIKNGHFITFGNNAPNGNGISDGAAKGQANE